jgi:formiminotetrahydrofolate cyclodeaminase
VRLAEARVNKALKAIQVVSNLSNKQNYEYTDEDVRLIVNALQKELTNLKSRFKHDGNANTSEFKLKA